MESYRRPAGRRALLPAELELCQAVGLSEEDYWYFVELSERYNGERSEAYANIPDIKNEPTAWAIASIVVSILSSAAAYILAPKPKSPEVGEGPRNLKLGGGRGQDRFAQTEGFQSVQELAVSGQTIPLVFTKKRGSIGGVRVNGSLVWSQMVAEKGYQQLRAVFVFSDGFTEGVPNYAGLAVGDTLLEGYTAKKVAAYWRQNGGRLLEPANRIPGSDLKVLPYSDAFSTFFDAGGPNFTGGLEPYFSGATFTSTQSKFGAFAPMFNDTFYRQTPQLILKPEDAEQDFKDDLKRKRDLNREKFAQGSFFRSVVDGNNIETIGYNGYLTVGHRMIYRLTTWVEKQRDDRWKPHELNFVNTATIAARNQADQQISEGELYLVGDKTLAVCTSVQGTRGANEPWAPSRYARDAAAPNTNDKVITFTLTEPGFVHTISNQGGVSASELYAITKPKHPAFSYPLQRAAVATISNTRPCSATELIIKSQVWRQLSGFTDVTAWPSVQLQAKYEKNNGSIQLGTLNKYIRRLSFFLLEVRPAGSSNWIDVTGDKYFFVEGNAPVDQYHYIRVDTGAQGNVETEFRLRPVSGVGAREKIQAGRTTMRKLQYGHEAPPYYAGGYVIVYNGKEVVMTEDYMSNPEFVKPSSRTSDKTTTVGVLNNIDLDLKRAGVFPEPKEKLTWTEVFSGYDSENYVMKYITPGDLQDNGYEFVYLNQIRASGTLSNHSIEPPQNRIDDYDLYWKYQWFLKTPGQENAIDNNRIFLGKRRTMVWRSIKAFRADVTYEDVKPTDARVTPAKNVTVANSNASGLNFFVQRYLHTDARGVQQVGYEWSVDFYNQGQNYTVNDFVIVRWEEVEGSGDYIDIHGVTILGTQDVTTTTTELVEPKENYSEYDAIQDVSAFEGVTSSNQNGPEHEVVAVNEKLVQSPPQYNAMTVGGLRINSSSEWSSFDSFSAYMQNGIILENLIDGSAVASNLLPDIVFGMMTNKDWGAGTALGPHQVDKDSMRLASQFCNANQFYWDGVVGEKINFRDWVYKNAQYALLDSTVVGGRFALIPAVPYTSQTKKIGNSIKPKIKALFTDGNMSGMQTRWLGPEERQLFQAEMIWRQETLNGFAKTKQFTMRFAASEGGSDKDPIETFDMSGFCTSQLHAARYAYYALRLRQQVDHSITFQTTPQAAMGLVAGDYFKVASNSTHTSRFNNGSINEDGFITSVEDLADGTHSVFFWSVGTEVVKEGTIVVSNGKVSDPAFYNTVFTVVMTNEQKRVYKLEALTYGDDGLIEITGSHMPLTDTGTLKILDWNPADFVGLGIDLYGPTETLVNPF